MANQKYTPTHQQATRIFAKFGGARRLAKAIGRDPSAVYKWNYPREIGGTDGLVPTSAIPDINAAADLLGITLTPEDWTP